LIVGIAYGLLISLILGGIELFLMEGPMLIWLSGLSFTTNLIIRSAIYAAIIMILQWFQVGEAIAGLPRTMSNKTFWYGFIYSAVISVLFNLVLGIANLIGGRTFLNFITGRYHTPVEENRFDGVGRAIGRNWHSPPSRSHISAPHSFGRGLSRRSPQLRRRRGDRNMARIQRLGRLSSAPVLCVNA
jgi:hypothetical protein